MVNEKGQTSLFHFPAIAAYSMNLLLSQVKMMKNLQEADLGT